MFFQSVGTLRNSRHEFTLKEFGCVGAPRVGPLEASPAEGSRTFLKNPIPAAQGAGKEEFTPWEKAGQDAPRGTCGFISIWMEGAVCGGWRTSHHTLPTAGWTSPRDLWGASTWEGLMEPHKSSTKPSCHRQGRNHPPEEQPSVGQSVRRPEQLTESSRRENVAGSGRPRTSCTSWSVRTGG